MVATVIQNEIGWAGDGVVTVNTPTGMVNGNTLLIFLYSRSPPNGWPSPPGIDPLLGLTPIFEGLEKIGGGTAPSFISVAWRTVDGTEPASYGLNGRYSSSAHALEISGADMSSLVAATGLDGAYVSTLVISALTAASADTLDMVLGGCEDSPLTFSFPAGFTAASLYEGAETNANSYIATETVGAGDTGTASVTWAPAGQKNCSGYRILIPASSGGGGIGIGSIIGVDNLGLWMTDGATPPTVSHWKRDGVDIPGATASTYTIVADDLGTTITAVINCGGVEAESEGTAIPAA